MAIDREKLDYNLQVELDRRALSDPKVSKMRTRKQVEEAFLEAFELVGGVPRLAMWANDPEHYGEFLKLYAKFMPPATQETVEREFTFVSNIPPSPLNRPKQQPLNEVVEEGQFIEHKDDKWPE